MRTIQALLGSFILFGYLIPWLTEAEWHKYLDALNLAVMSFMFICALMPKD